MVDGPPSRSYIRTSALNTVENSTSSCNLPFVGQRKNTLVLLPRCFIKLRRIKTAFNVNNSWCMKVSARDKGDVSTASLGLRSTVKCEEIIPSMSLPQKIRSIRKTARKTKTQGNRQVLNIGAQLPHLKTTQNDCRTLVVKLKRLCLEKPPGYAKKNEKGSCTEHNTELCPSTKVEALQDQCAFNLHEKPQVTRNIKRAVVKLTRIELIQTKEKELSGCTDEVVLSHQYVSNGSENQTKSKLQVTSSIKRAIVRLRRFKLDNTTNPLRTNTSPKENSQLKYFKQSSILAKGERKSDAKMKTRFNSKKKVMPNLNKATFVPEPKEKPKHQTSSSNVFLTHNELITDLVMTPERRNNLKRLSLTTRSLKPNSADPNATKICEISRFSPVRNSTVFGIGEKTYCEQAKEDISTNCTKPSGDSTELRKENSNSRDEWSRKSLTNQPDLIEQLLFSECSREEEQEHCKGEDRNETTRHITKNENRTHKFFHRLPETELRPKKVPSEPDTIFDYLSQSDTSGSEKGRHIDPAADVIKKMISAGKVRVAVNRKGTGRPILKRYRPKNGRKKQLTNNNIASKAKDKKEKTTTTVVNKSIRNDIHNNDDGNTPLHPVAEYVEDDHHDATEYFNDQQEADDNVCEGRFSRLARSVLLQQTKKYENSRKKNLAEQRRLLEIARKFVSTPATYRKRVSFPPADLSPIQTLSTQRRPVCPSPWRIDNDAHLPGVFNFAKNTSCLPSFSSDYIPATPKKSKQNNNSQICNDYKPPFESSEVTEHVNAGNVTHNMTTHNSNGQLHGSVGSSNDSNAENMPPPASTAARPVHNNDENADIFNLRQLHNPRRTLEHRSPLKAINIIEVVSLPPWKTPVNNDAQNVKPNDPTAAGENSKYDEKHNADDLFGFDEFLDPNSDDDGEPPSAANITKAKMQSIKRNLHKKLKDLKKWRPKNSDHDESNAIIKPCSVFDDNEGRPKQRLIKEMLCSTMINQINQPTGQDNTLCNWDEGNVQPIENDFFNDYEPETTFDKKPQRTYARPVKRKRKCRKNFVMFLDSSEESNLDSDEEQHARRKVGQKKHRDETHAKAKEKSELKSFVDEFNTMCKEVENYELHVE